MNGIRPSGEFLLVRRLRPHPSVPLPPPLEPRSKTTDDDGEWDWEGRRPNTRHLGHGLELFAHVTKRVRL